MVAPYQPPRPPWLQPGAMPYQPPQPQYMQWAQPGVTTPWQQAQMQAQSAPNPNLWQQPMRTPAWGQAQQQAAPAAPQWQPEGVKAAPTWQYQPASELSFGGMDYSKDTSKDAIPAKQPQTEGMEGEGQQMTAQQMAQFTWSQRTAGFTGSTYQGLLGKFDPWGNWGRYGPRQNGVKKHQTAAGLESDQDRVYRWTNDILRSMGYAGGENAPPELRTRIFLANVERLKSEYGVNKQDWATSDFYNMDQQLTADGTPPGALPATAQTGGGNTGNTGGNTGGQTGGGNVGGTGQPQMRNFGQFQTDDMAALLQAAANDPERAAQILRLARGQTGRPLGRMADFRDSLYGRSFQTALSLAGMDGMGTMEGMAGDFLNNAVQGNNLAGYAGGLGRQVAGMNFEGMDSNTMERALRAGLALQGVNMGAMGGSVQQGRLEDIVWQDWARSLGNTQNDTRNFSDLLQNSPFLRAMQQFGA